MDLLTPEFGLFFWQCITFMFLLVMLKKFAWKPILNTIKKREEYISHTFLEAEKAEKMIQSVSQQKEEIRKLAEQEREEIISEGFSSKAALIEEAKKEASCIINLAIKKSEELIKDERQRAILQLQSEVTILSTMIAEKLLEDHLAGSQKQEELIKNILQKSTFVTKSV